jgi:hypothetical protein
LEVKVKKAHLSPVASLGLSFSLVFGILVSDLSAYRLLTVAHAEGNSCSNGTMLSARQVKIVNGLALGGFAFRAVSVNGQVIGNGVIAGSVVINDTTVAGVNGVLVGDEHTAPTTNGVLVGDDDQHPTTNGVLVGDEEQQPTLTGVLVGDVVTIGNAVVSIGGTVNGGTLTGDDITITDGVITGQNLTLTGATINGGPIHIQGAITNVQVSPAG